MYDKWLLCPIANKNSVLGSIPAAGPQNEMCVEAVSCVMLMHTFQSQQSDLSINKQTINQFRTVYAYNNVNMCLRFDCVCKNLQLHFKQALLVVVVRLFSFR